MKECNMIGQGCFHCLTITNSTREHRARLQHIWWQSFLSHLYRRQNHHNALHVNCRGRGESRSPEQPNRVSRSECRLLALLNFALGQRTPGWIEGVPTKWPERFFEPHECYYLIATDSYVLKSETDAVGAATIHWLHDIKCLGMTTPVSGPSRGFDEIYCDSPHVNFKRHMRAFDAITNGQLSCTCSKSHPFGTFFQHLVTCIKTRDGCVMALRVAIGVLERLRWGKSSNCLIEKLYKHFRGWGGEREASVGVDQIVRIQEIWNTRSCCQTILVCLWVHFEMAFR